MNGSKAVRSKTTRTPIEAKLLAVDVQLDTRDGSDRMHSLQGRVSRKHSKCSFWASTCTVEALNIVEFVLALCKANPFQLSNSMLSTLSDA